MSNLDLMATFPERTPFTSEQVHLTVHHNARNGPSRLLNNFVVLFPPIAWFIR